MELETGSPQQGAFFAAPIWLRGVVIQTQVSSNPEVLEGLLGDKVYQASGAIWLMNRMAITGSRCFDFIIK